MELSKKSISIAFVIILAITILVSLLGMLLMSHQPLVLQGQIETTEIRISGKLPGRVDSFLVREGDWVQAGDTLVVIAHEFIFGIEKIHRHYRAPPSLSRTMTGSPPRGDQILSSSGSSARIAHSSLAT